MDKNTFNAILSEKGVNGIELVRGLFDYDHSNDTNGAIDYIKSKVECDDKIAKEILERLFPKFGQDSTPAPAPQEDNVVHCPKCNSTSIGLTKRGWKLATGLIGANNVLNVCQNCGHKWKPGK